MHLENSFTVPLPFAEAWDVLLDIERIAPCMPGAELQEVEGEEYRGVVKVRLGAVTTQFKGAMRLDEVDRDKGVIVMKAEGRDVRGQGNAKATVTAVLLPTDAGTQVDIDTDLAITGKLAQFGRGVMGDVSKRLLDQFVTCLEADLRGTRPVAAAAGGSAGTATAAPVSAPAAATGTAVAEPGPGPVAAEPAAPGIRKIESRPAEPVDVLRVAGGSVAERALPAAVVGLLVAIAVVRSAPRRWALAAIGAVLVTAATRGQRRPRA